MAKRTRRCIQIGIAFFTVASWFCSSSAMAACVPRPSALDAAVGPVELGTPTSEVPEEVSAIFYYDGDYRDDVDGEGGVVYDRLISKALDTSSMYANILVLPFGLSKFDKMDAVLKKIKPYLKAKLIFEEENPMSEEGKVVHTGFCFYQWPWAKICYAFCLFPFGPNKNNSDVHAGLA